MKKDKLTVKMVDPRSLIPYENNAKRHDEAQVKQIIGSIKQFGFNDPIGIDENGVVIEGHGRLLAALEMGLAEVPVMVISGLSDEQKKAYALVHNKLTFNSGFDIDVLEEELAKITDIDMTFFSFNEGESYFDPDSEYVREAKGEIVVILEKDEAQELKDWLDERLIDYKESNAR